MRREQLNCLQIPKVCNAIIFSSPALGCHLIQSFNVASVIILLTSPFCSVMYSLWIQTGMGLDTCTSLSHSARGYLPALESVSLDSTFFTPPTVGTGVPHFEPSCQFVMRSLSIVLAHQPELLLTSPDGYFPRFF